MGNIISKMGLYDLLARGVTGVIVLCVAHVFGIVDILDKPDCVWVIILGGYFLGLVLEELSLIGEKGFYRMISEKRDDEKGTRKKIENYIFLQYPDYDFENCKKALIANDKEIIMDEPLAHVVMSDSFKIAFLVLAVVKLIQIVFPEQNIVAMPGDENRYIAIIKMVSLVFLSIVFSQRARHYCERRTKSIFDYCIAQNYPGIKKKVSNKDKGDEA